MLQRSVFLSITQHLLDIPFRIVNLNITDIPILIINRQESGINETFVWCQIQFLLYGARFSFS